MAARTNSNVTIRKLAVNAAPFVIIGLTSMALRTPLAAAYPLAALLLFLWIVSDTMMLSLLARSSGRPDWHVALGGMASASIIVWLGTPPALRELLSTIPVIWVAMVVIVLGHITWATVRARRALNAPGQGIRDR